MLTLKTKKLELRGVETQVSRKTNNTYYVLYCEDVESSKPHQFFCKDFNIIPQGLKKGDYLTLTVDYNNYKDLVVVKVEKVGA